MLCTGTSIGPYEVLAAIGAGGMGEVYRARDSRLARDVAIKVIPRALASDTSRLRRFEQEAQAAGMLNHPNLVAVYDFGTAGDGVPYLVTELLEGETLRNRLASGPIPVRKAIDYALQIAHGLAAAHDKGIVHRDLKPENLFVTRDGRVKILDFGLAKLVRDDFAPLTRPAKTESSAGIAATVVLPTEPGTLLGTVGYMSPEQVRGAAVDHRTDLFSFGTVLYEMLSGRRAFGGDSGVETLYAILEEEPRDLADFNPALPPALERIVMHALEKNPEERFQSARDLGFHLQAISNPSGASRSTAIRSPGRRRRRTLTGTAIGLGLAAALITAFLAGKGAVRVPAPVFKQLTFRRGTLDAARFAPDGQAMVYSAGWDGMPSELFTTRVDAVESRPLGLANADLLAVSTNGEMAVLLGSHPHRPFTRSGTLARVLLAGGAPREIAANVQAADWSPDGTTLAIVRDQQDKICLEYPMGTVLYSTAGWIGNPRVSRDGTQIAFIDHPMRGDDGGAIAVVDKAGHKQTLSSGWLSAQGLAWSSRGDEVWFTATRVGIARAVHAVTLTGQERQLSNVPGTVTLHDITADGRLLLSSDVCRMRAAFARTGETAERDLSWLDWSLLRDLSADGKTILINETGEGAGATYGIYVRGTDGSPAVRLGDGVGMALSPDGLWALSFLHGSKESISLLPTGAGEARAVACSLGVVRWMAWFPDGKRILVLGGREDEAPQLYELGLSDGTLRAITHDAIVGPAIVSPDGTRLVARDSEWRPTLYQVADGTTRLLPGLSSALTPVRWSADGGCIYLSERSSSPEGRVLCYDMLSCKAVPQVTIVPSDPAGIRGVAPIAITPDGKAYAYSSARVLSSLFLVDDLR